MLALMCAAGCGAEPPASAQLDVLVITVDTLRAAENQLLREEVEQLRPSARHRAPGGSSSSSPLARSAGAKERHAARAEREQRRRDEQQSALDQSLKGFSRPGEVSI